jgi:hypothetical protein
VGEPACGRKEVDAGFFAIRLVSPIKVVKAPGSSESRPSYVSKLVELIERSRAT